jgi:phospho-N-acetylmuramoyl-pentapeptide-transferase
LISLYPAIATFLIVTAVIPLQTRLFKAYNLVQPIRKELPADQQKKRGTPLMGGLVFLIGAIATLCVEASTDVRLLTTTFFLFALIGFMDDAKKAHTKIDGISAKTKMLLQCCFTGGILYYLLHTGFITSHIPITRNIALDLPVALFIVAVGLIIVGSTNAINFTDGLDGLLSVVAIPTYFFFFVISQHEGVRLFCLMMIACLLAFLIYNRHPAKLIMGDTGSMAIGGTLALMAVIDHVVILLPILFLVYFAEILSVIIQVSYFKRTGKRIFRMSPIHYHFSLKYGWDENTIVIVFGSVSWICSLACLLYYYLLLR